MGFIMATPYRTAGVCDKRTPEDMVRCRHSWGFHVPDALLKIRFDGNQPRLSFVQGEDRTIGLSISDDLSGHAVDLTGASLQVAFLGLDGRALKRRSAGLAVASASVAPSTGVLTAVGHGLVTGDIVRVAATAGSTLPGGLAPGIDYLVSSLTADTFMLLTTAGAAVALTNAGAGSLEVTSTNLAIDDAAGGHAVLNLPAALTAEVVDGQMQDLQVSIRSAAGMVRIAVIKGCLDVYPQAVP